MSMTTYEAMAKESMRSRRVLVVDDSETDAYMISQLLFVMGHLVEVAHNGRDALVKANRFLPDLILCDVCMPEMDGFSFAKCMRQRVHVRPMMVALSGYSEPSDFDEAWASGFDKYLVKPIEIRQLQDLIESLADYECSRN